MLLQRVHRFVGMHAYVMSARGAEQMLKLNTPVSTHVDHAMARGAARGELDVFGVSRRRILQSGKGSDVRGKGSGVCFGS